ncbi:MAG: GAK system ATP-grasp enzyme [Nitrospinae bacterium]|nr:GAK system ATP-grasp enzyme [Nitrospinota bacterium]
MYKIGVIGVPGNWSSEALADEVEKKTGTRLLMEMKKITLDLGTGKAFYKDIEVTALDALIIKKIGLSYCPDFLDRLEVIQFIESRGVRVFSKPGEIISMLNRLSCTIKLRENDIPMPQTFITEDVEKAAEMVEKYKKAIAKPLYSTKARGMKVLEPGNGLIKELEEFKQAGNQSIYLQKMIDIPEKDLGVAFLGGKYVATYARVGSKESWNTTIHSGGKYEPYNLSPNLIELAEKAQAIFDLDFTCVDLVETDEGPMILEVSAFGGFKGLRDAHNINIAEKYTEYVIKELKNG